MAPKAAQQAAQKKAAKQKKLLIALSLPAAGALFFAVHTFMNLNSHPSDSAVSATPAASTTPASSIPSGSSTTSTTPALTGITAPPVGSLSSFTALGRKDPFHDNGPRSGAAPSSSTNSSSNSNGSSKGKGSNPIHDAGGGKSGGSKQPPAPLTGAVISLNGTKLPLAIGTKFGHAPGLSGVSLFRLVSVTRTSAVIAVVGTTQQFTLHTARPLTLEQNGGWTYTLTLEPLGTNAPMTVQTTTTSTTPGK